MSGIENRWIASILYLPVALGALCCALAPVLIAAPRTFVLANLAVYGFGFLMFLQARRSLRARRARAEARTGSRAVPMTPSNRLLHRIGNLLMFLATVLTFILYNLTFVRP